ncbi:Exodeoxyribonuclease 1 [Fulvia fulva]|uniref:Exodeoxyribonuclease 1 n=1 Tax=Passalora fulva TaxID=5499 RepID=A0A9Q8PJW1_PASFU|nr:Exodeoxyribonuclease 1 [Fulvia fulva]KAK4611647.1 Exodeoxyribonuclease 1 [Fulvia fulva]KAK4612797.1 Exodeoxyribonuclease 1 [Fulvia fulva]UJO23791.1 Exodeoxyribonuclease 1 [Fulvia fulva]WPV20940.1 Exodeoxyribonuclease 1 [Fulvia fulva]WPV36309.1 Exodeoxyribonuclease 1 [Fulvia fulva]
MGIQGLLPLLKSIHKPTHLRNFSGQTLGVDAYGWLHRGTVSCAIELAEGKPTRRHIDFALHRVRMLIHFGVKPYIVFDGDYLPSKAHTEKERAARRKESKRVGLELLRMGRPSQAHLELQKAVDVTPVMARELIEELKRLDVPYVVAPYEADSQLAYLEKQGTIDGVISEDSDLLVFGVKCLLTKLDQYGECVMINRSDFTSCREVSLVGWTDKEFRMMAMLSGCDYLPGIDKMGLKTAYRLVRKHKTVDRVVRTVQFDGKMKVPAGYLDAFQRAERTFMHQWVFCPQARCLLNLYKLPEGLDAASIPYIGKHVEPELAAGVARGDLDPNTKQPIQLPNRFQDRARTHSRTVQTPGEKKGTPITEFFKKRTPLAELDPNSFTPSPTQQRLLEPQSSVAWSASQIPAPVRSFGLSRSTTAPVPSSSAPRVSRRHVTDPFPSTRASPKRQRLCSESNIATAMKGNHDLQEGMTSRFFAKTPAQDSPSTRRKSSKKEEFDLWSDDSVAEAVAAATATPELTQTTAVSSPRKRKKLAVFADPPADEGDTSVGDMTQDSIDTTVSSVFDDVTESGTPDTSFADTPPPREASTFSKEIAINFAALKYNSPSATRRTITRANTTPLPSSILPQKTQRGDTTASAVEEIQEEVRGTVVEEAALVPNSSPAMSRSKHTVVAADDDIIDDDEFLAAEKEPLHSRHTFSPKGSEDMLVPESPGEASDSSGGQAKPGLCLSRFAFVG